MKRLTAIFFLSVIMIFMCLVPFSVIERKKEQAELERKRIVMQVIDWRTLYPFYDDEHSAKPRSSKSSVTMIYQRIKDRLDDYTTKYLIGSMTAVETAKKYEDLIGWNIASAYAYNEVMKLPDGYLTGIVRNVNVSNSVEALIVLKDYCAERGIDFFYVNAPHKICVSEDKGISGVLDFSNQNADKMLEQLSASGVKAYDLRAMLHEDDMKHHESFYRTDHHWKVETALWAAKHILQILKDDYGWDVKPELLNHEDFERVVYPEWFLGSQGRKFMLARTKPDDFTFTYPKYETRFHCEVPVASVDKTGDFMVLCDMSKVVSKDYYNLSPYHAYSYGDQALIRITNLLTDNDKRVLMIDDSFADAVIPFLAIGIKHVEAMNLRHMVGSLKRYIDENTPDLVIVMYNEDSIGGGINPSKRGGHFNFR